MPRLVIVGDGDAERDISISAPVIQWNKPVSQAFTDLHEPVCRYLLALGLTPAQTEEVVQETFLRLCQHLDANGAQDNLRGWIFRVAHNLARDEYRRNQRQPCARVEDVGAHADPSATPEEQIIAREKTSLLAAAMEKLPLNQQHCLHLRAEGLRYREIAEVLNVSVSTVGDWVQQALKALVKECNETRRE